MSKFLTTKILVAATALMSSNIAFGQASNNKITGIIIDSVQKPLQYATIELYKQNQLTTVVKNTYSNEKGVFTISAIDTGSYTLVISHTGFASEQKNINVGQESAIDLRSISLTPSNSTMTGVVISTKKPLIEQTDDKIVFNVENDPATKTENAIDILRKTPFVTVDGDDNVSVNGQTNFKVLLNGRETAMFAQNVKEALKGFPGALITKIEVITNPSAKYDAEGVGGIINIITKKKVAGYNGSVNLWYTNTGWWNANGNLSAKYGKIGVTLNYGSGGGESIPGTSKMETLPLVPSAFTRRLATGSRNMTNFWNFGNAEVSWDMDTLHTFSFYGNISGGYNHNQLNQVIDFSYPSVPDTIINYSIYTRNEYPTKSIGADYIQHFAGNKEKEFSIRFNGEFSNSNTFLNSLMDYPVQADLYVINTSIASNKQYTLESDYVLPLKNNKKLEAGVKAILRKADSDFESMNRATASGEYKINPTNTDQFNYNQDVYSAYGTYSFKVNKTSFRLGARLENTTVSGNFVSAQAKVKQNYANLIPNIQITTKFSNAFTLVFAYSDRLQRPAIYNLNPFKSNNDPFNVTYGNPELNAQVIHSASIQTRFMKGATFAGLTFTGTYTDNLIVQYASFDANTGVTSTTSANLGKEIAGAVNGNISTKITKDWNVFLNGGVRYNHVENLLMPSQTNSGFSGNANLNMSYSFSKKFNASSYAGFYRSPVTIQTSYPLNMWYGISAGYKMFKEKLTASFGMSNFFEKEHTYKLVTIDPLFQYTSQSTFPFRGISLSLSYNFGKLTENVSKKKGVQNDDQLSSGNSSNN